MFWLFGDIKDPESKQNAEIRKHWDSKKILLRFRFSIMASVFIVIGFELSTPNYSMSTWFVEEVLTSSELLKSVFTKDWAQEIFVSHFDKDSNLPVYSGTPAKFTLFFIVLFLVSRHFLSSDPYSNSELLRNLASPGDRQKPFLVMRWMREIGFYAIYCPSNRLPERCRACATKGCLNRLASANERKTFHWNRIFASLPSALANDLLKSTHKCRAVFLSRYSLWFSAAFLIPVYFFARLFEYNTGLEVNKNSVLIGYIAVLWLTGLLIGYLNSSTTENARGVLGTFKECVSNIMHMSEYKEAFERVVCGHDDRTNKFRDGAAGVDTEGIPQNTWEFQALVTMLRYLDDVVKGKLLEVRSFSEETQQDKNSLRRLLAAVTEMYIAIHNNQYRFRSALFVPDKESEFLVPLVDIPFPDQDFFSLQGSYSEDNFSKTSRSVASESWVTRQPVYKAGLEIPEFHEGQREYLKSIAAVPICLDYDLGNLLAADNIQVDSIVGVLCIDSDNVEVFSGQNSSLNELLIRPFANRLVFEMVSGLRKTKYGAEDGKS